MIEKIKKLVESSNYEDNKLALILIYKTYGEEKLLEMGDDTGRISLFGTNKDTEANGLIIGDYMLFHSNGGYVCFQEVNRNIVGMGFINWENEKENTEIVG